MYPSRYKDERMTRLRTARIQVSFQLAERPQTNIAFQKGMLPQAG